MTEVGATSGQGPTDQGIRDKLRAMFDELVEIKVITLVGNVTVSLPESGHGRATVKTDTSHGDAIVTMFNLIDGDVTNVIAPALKDDQAIREFHATQVEKSMVVLPANIAALVDFAKALLNDLKS